MSALIDLEERTETKSPRVLVESDEFLRVLDSCKRNRKFSDLTALIVDATETSRWDVFGFLQKEVLHLGAVSVATLLKEAGFKDSKAVYEVLTSNYDYSRENPDVIGVSTIVTNVPYANRKIEQFRRAHPNTLILAGGAGYAFNPEVAMRHGADACIVGKAEYSLLELLSRLALRKLPGENLRDVLQRTKVDDIQGVYDGSRENVDFAPMVKDLDAIPVIDYGLIHGKQARSMRSIKDSEGCVHNCDFCSTVILHGGKYRKASAERIVEDMKRAKKEKIRQAFFVGDHALARNYGEIYELCEAIRRADLDMTWVAQATMSSIDKNLENGILDDLGSAGCSTLCLGMESISDEELKGMNASAKNSYEISKRVLGAIKDSAVEAHIMAVLKPFVSREKKEILPFSAEDSPAGIRMYGEEIRKMVDFLKESEVRSAQFHSAIPLPGTRSSERYFDAGIVLKRIGGKDIGWDKYTGQYVVASSNPLASYRIMEDAYKRFYSLGYIFKPFIGTSPKNKLAQLFFRAIGRGITEAHLMSREGKDYLRALEKRDFEYYRPGEKPVY